MTATQFATLDFRRSIDAPPMTVWQAWTAPAARALWAAPSDAVTVEFLSADTRVGGTERSVCRVAGQPDTGCETHWLALEPATRSVNSEKVSRDGQLLSVALVTATVAAEAEGSRLDVTVQLAGLAGDMAAGYREGFGAGIGNLCDVAERMMVIQRVIRAPAAAVWAAWTDAESLPLWWGPDGFSCRTKRIDLRSGGEWVFDMIGPDGTVFPNHHRYGVFDPRRRLDYALHWGEDGPKHADAWASFDETEDAGGRSTTVTLGMVMSTAEEWHHARGFGAPALGLQTLGKLEARVLAAQQAAAGV